VQLIGEIGSQAADIARTQGEINGLNAAREALAKQGRTEPGPDASAEDKADYQAALHNSDAYKTTMAQYGTGSDLQRGIQAATAALQGLAGGDIAGVLAGASAPELANYIGHGSGLSDEAAVVAHAILGGAVAALQGNSAAAGAAGAATGELAARAIAGMLYPGVTDLSTLTEAQKQTVSTLATISAGMAGGLAGDSTASAAAGAQGGKNAVENNSLCKYPCIREPFSAKGEVVIVHPRMNGGGISRLPCKQRISLLQVKATFL
jgi:filamentous hemagglutinin